MATKYKQYFNQMFNENRELFHQFMVVSQKYSVDRDRHHAKFNQLGRQVVEIVREWENRLCRQIEKGKHSVFSARLADKYWAEVRKFMPLIDLVGVEIIKTGTELTPSASPEKSRSQLTQNTWLDNKINI